MSLFDDCQSSDSENDADYVPEDSSEEELLASDLVENETDKSKLAESDEKICTADEKKKTDDLFRTFLTDCEAEMKAREAESGIIPSVSTSDTNSESSPAVLTPTEVSETICVSSALKEKGSIEGEKAVEVFDFAGETVCVSKDGSSVSVLNEANDSKKKDEPKPVLKRGLASVLGAISKKPKLSVLEKSKLDWTSYKRSEGIEEDLRKHNIGKGGYIERRRFLERSDARAFEIERNMRLSRNKK